MGKSQKKRSMRRHNPVRVPDSHLPKGLSSASSTSSKLQEIPPILQKMESADASERKWACVAVSNLIHNDPSTRRLLQGKNVVGVLISRLTDSEDEVVTEAMGALRNLCIDGGYDICAEMYNKNILTPLRSFIPKISTTLAQYLTAPSSAPENSRKMVYEFADNVITTLWCLSETSNKALNAINQINLIPFLTSFLASYQRLPLAPVVAAAQCLYVLTDDNPPAIDEVKSDGSYIATLFSIAQPTSTSLNGKQKEEQDERSVTLRVLVAGILRNISPIPPPSVATTVNLDKDIILPLLQTVITSVSLSGSSDEALRLVSQQANEPQIDRPSLKNTPKSDHKSESEHRLERIESRLRILQLALEVMTGMCAALPDYVQHDREGEDDNSDEENGSPDDTGETMLVDDAALRSEKPSFMPQLVPPLLTLIQPVTLSFPPSSSPSHHPPTTSVLSAIHLCALECLNNIFLSLATSKNASIAEDKQSGQRIWQGVWSALGAVGTEFGLGQERRKEMWEIAVGVLWGLGNVWKATLTPSEEQVNVLIQFCEATSDPRIKVQCIGALENLAQHPDAIDANRIILNYLISLLPTITTPSSVGTEPLIQVVSALIDIYSDENMPYDINFTQVGALQKLADAVEGLKKAVRGIDRKKEGGYELKRRGADVRDNLLAFIEYRRDLGH